MLPLSELLALLPDNTTGDIGADDLRAIVSELYLGIETVAATAQSIGPTQNGVWQVNPAAGVPQGGQVCPKDGTFQTTTALRFVKLDKNNVDQSASLMLTTRLYGQLVSDSSNFIRYDVTGVLDAGAYVELAVTFSEQGGPVGAASWLNALWVMTLSEPLVGD